MKVRYLKLDKAEGPLIVMDEVREAVYGEVVDIEVSGKEHRMGKVVQIDRRKVIIQVFQGTVRASERKAHAIGIRPGPV